MIRSTIYSNEDKAYQINNVIMVKKQIINNKFQEAQEIDNTNQKAIIEHWNKTK